MKKQSYKIGFYIRVSTDEQAENPEGSIKNQEERLLQTVKFKNMEGNFGEVVGVFIDRAKSGKDTNRPELQKLLQEIRMKKISLVMVSELSRVSRNIMDFSNIWEMMKKNSCGFYSLRENFDTTTAAGEMVLYTLANLAQFERRQVSERVAANMNARAARGLYNGGCVPLGYRLNPDKPGNLEVDPEMAVIVRTCYSSFIEKGTLTTSAKWLNDNNYRKKKTVDGGGGYARLDFFTCDNLHHILRNKLDAGIREYKQNGEVKQTTAIWEPIIDMATFDRVQKILTENCSAKKPMTATRYPYLLTGFVRCATCGNPMVGKSAHGKREKFGYYEHSWATKKDSFLSKKLFKCDPHRVNANKLELLVIRKVQELLCSDVFAKELIQDANRAFEEGSSKKEIDRLKSHIYGYNSQLEAIAERLSQLPKSVSPKPIFQQMEKIEKYKAECTQKIRDIEGQGVVLERPANLKEYKDFLAQIFELFKRTDNKEIQAQIIKNASSEYNLLI